MLDRRTGEIPIDGLIFDAQVRGESKSKGSLRNVARRGQKAHLVEQVEGSTEWMNTLVKDFHRRVRLGDGRNPALMLPGYPYNGAVCVKVLFTFQKPSNSPLRYPSTTTYYDLDKLQRNLGDALQKGDVLQDDSRIIEWHSKKRFVEGDGAVGLFVYVFDARTVNA